jgi:prepilin-type N-terminal cleavage/methylation domain-containing protein
MTFSKLKTMKKDRGFTIVELLIVIVVIAILAAIVIVAYNGVQNRAKTTSAQASAVTLQKKLEAYNASQGSYPAAASATTSLNTVTEAALTGTGLSIGTPTASTGTTTIKVAICSAPAAATGYQITYWDYNAGSLPGTPQIAGGTNSTACTTYTAAT